LQTKRTLMTDNDIDKWRRNQLNEEFKKNAKDHLSPKFNQQDQIKIHDENIKLLQKEYLQLQKNMRKKAKHEFNLEPKKGTIGRTRNRVHIQEGIRRQKEAEKRRDQIKKEITQRQEEIKKLKEKDRDRYR